MRVALDPVPLVIGIYAYVGTLLARASSRHEETNAEALAKRFARQREQAADRDIQRLVRTLHTDVKTADKLLKKTADVWKISQETDLVDLVVRPRGEEPAPRAYILLQAGDVRSLLEAIRDAARGAGTDEETVGQIERGAEALPGRAGDYVMFGFDPWGL